MRRPLPPLNALKSFEAAARLGSFRAAGDAMCVSHSAISYHVKQLERHLGLAVFHRAPRALSLTAAGRTLYATVRESFNRIADTADRLVAPRGNEVLTLQLYSTLTVRWLIPRLAEFEAQHPGLRLRLITSQDDVDFSRDEIEACVLIGHPHYADLDYTYLFSSDLFPVASPAFLARTALKVPTDLARVPLLQVHPSHADWSIWLDHAGITTVDPDAGLSFDSYDHALATARLGLGVALAMDVYVADELATGMLTEPFAPLRATHPANWWFVARRAHTAQPKIRAFRAWLVAAVTADGRLRRNAPPRTTNTCATDHPSG
ncbi:MAG: LysR substrate-binding domain-containing protein [Pseudomonadota bacterium]|jgi:LysR family glycine cleavage system transcriptional activator